VLSNEVAHVFLWTRFSPLTNDLRNAKNGLVQRRRLHSSEELETKSDNGDSKPENVGSAYLILVEEGAKGRGVRKKGYRSLHVILDS